MIKAKIKLNSLLLFALIVVLFTSACSVVRKNTGPEYRSDRFAERVINLKVVVDKDFTNAHNDWEEIIKEVVKKSSEQFDAQFNIKFKIKKIEGVEIPAVGSVSPLATQLRAFWPFYHPIFYQHIVDAFNVGVTVNWLASNIDLEGCDILVCFSEEKYGTIWGYVNSIFGNCALIACGGKTDSSIKTTIHEIGHLFGAVHIKDPSSVMFRRIGGSIEFDVVNKRIIFQNKWREFRDKNQK